MGSALLFVGISIVSYVIILGMLMQFTPMILGTVYTVIGALVDSSNMDAAWLTIYNDLDALSQTLVSMLFSLLLVLLVIKVLMAAGVGGRD